MATTVGASIGHGNFPNGNAFATIFSRELLLFNRRMSVAEAITNSKYEGNITGQGSEVQILLEPELTVSEYTRGKKLIFQSLNDETTSLLIDQAYSVSFTVDTIEKLLSHIDWGSKLSSQMTYKLKDKFDSNVLSAMSSGATNSATNLGTNASPKNVGHDASDDFKPLDYMLRAARVMDDNDVPEMNRYWVAKPSFYEKLHMEDSAKVDASFTGEAESDIAKYKFASLKPVHGFTLFKSNNIPAAATTTNEIVLAGQIDAATTAQALLKSEVTSLPETFGVAYKALHVFGRKVVKPANLFRGHIVT